MVWLAVNKSNFTSSPRFTPGTRYGVGDVVSIGRAEISFGYYREAPNVRLIECDDMSLQEAVKYIKFEAEVTTTFYKGVPRKKYRPIMRRNMKLDIDRLEGLDPRQLASDDYLTVSKVILELSESFKLRISPISELRL